MATRKKNRRDPNEVLSLEQAQAEGLERRPIEDPPWAECPLVPEMICRDCGGYIRRTPSGLACGEHGDTAIAGTSARRTKTGARVVFHERPTTRLDHYDHEDLVLMNPADRDLAGSFVKVSVTLRPSERDAFDARALKEELRLHGALAVLLAVHPVAEAPDQAAKAEASVALRPEDAIAAWFDALPVPEEDRVAAKARALEILAAEGG